MHNSPRRGLLRLAGAFALALGMAAAGSSAANAQGSTVYQNGTAVASHMAKFVTNGRIADVGGILGDAAGLGGSPFSVTDNNGLGICSYTASTLGAYKSICLGHDSSGAGLISISGGTEFNFEINGTTYPFPGPGNGNVLGPTPAPAVNELAIWNAGWTQRAGPPANLTDNKTGAITSSDEGGIITATSGSGITAKQIANWVFCDCTAPVSYDALRGIAVDNGAQTIDLVNGVSGYVISNSVKGSMPGGYPTGVALFGMGIAAADGANIWGVNSAVTDNEGQVVSSHADRALYGAEFDVNFTSVGSTAFGMVVQGASLAQGYGVGISCGPLDLAGYTAGTTPAAKWEHCFDSADAATDIGISLGRTTHTSPATANASSQKIILGYNTAAALPENVQLFADGTGTGGQLSVRNTEGTLTTLYGVDLIIPSSLTKPSAITIGYYTGGTPAAGSPVGGQPVSVPSQTVIYQYSDAAGYAQAIFTKAVGGALEIFDVSSSGSQTYVRSGAFVSVNMPTSCTSQPTGTLWNSSGTVHVC